ncbi:PHD-finger domain-containing protein, putative [Eimeria tenella]|uniref:PHD-finger domain-containing protein, putative n=1 Tax=Eimeria tenella TaxID=5802 RepID=U6KNS7_EIMTE|nr:PHD-finger domain-containing protein, putative [Eimeria tenella]CDJ39772.1 PHD-finger domain-containing protein, putative [Eimeria tenella]|eukprot:XP_013230525.1 PHD-finger domain-containing protein, putative [Eimeria tenella]
MEEERCSIGAIRAEITEVPLVPTAHAASQHPADQVDPVVASHSKGSEEDQKNFESSLSQEKKPQDNGKEAQGGGSPATILQEQVSAAPMDSEAKQDSGAREASQAGCFGSGTEAVAATSGDTAMDVEGDAGDGATPPESSDMGSLPNGTAEAATEIATVEADAMATETGDMGTVAMDEAGDTVEAESDGKESNDSVCNECGGGGEVVCCDGCVKSYHTDCLPVVARPRLRASADDWFCPECTAANAAPPPTAAVPSTASAKLPQAPSDHRSSRQSTAVAPPPVCPPSAPTAHWSAVPSCVPSRRRKAKVTEDYETRINVGPNHQVPHLPDFFLARGDSDCLSTLAEHSLNDGAQSQALGPLLVYSPYLMERSKQQCLAERATKSCITSQKDLAEFLIKCSKRWKVRPGWQPFSPEFAYKLLHRANYDPERALRMMDDSAFCFQSVCDPPLRKYENKWKRRDKRGTFPSSPYPPPVVVRGYLNEKQKQLRMGR